MIKRFSLLAILFVVIAVYLQEILKFTSIFFTEKHKNLFTEKELSTFNGVINPLLFLSILGNVFNVTKGEKHYGPGKQYHGFVGKDASKSFITGDTSSPSDDIIDFNGQELLSLLKWLNFYKKEYKQIGKLIGRYYDKMGKLTIYGKEVKRLIKKAEEDQLLSKKNNLNFPFCNIEWNAEKGTRVWCTNRSGGIERNWTGRPRQYYDIDKKDHRCACIKIENLSLGNIKEYPGCPSESDSCFVTV